MRRTRCVVTGMLVVCLVAMGVGVGMVQAADKPVKIGCLFALSGPARHIGVPSKYVAEMARAYFEAQGGIEGRTIELVFGDTKGEAAVAISEFQRLVRQDEVCAVIGPTRTGTCMAMLQSIERAEVPVVACVGGTPPVVPTRTWVFKSPQKTVTAVEKVYEYLRREGMAKVALITSQDAFGEEGKGDLMRTAEEYGISVVGTESFGTSDIDMTIQLRKLVATDAEAVICWTIGPGGATVARNFAALDAPQLLIQCHGQPDPTYLELAGDAAEGSVMPSTKVVVADQLPEDDPQKEVVERFATQYEAEYGPVSAHSGYAWDAFMMVAEAIRRTGSADPDAIRDGIEATTGYVGVSGIYTMGPDDHSGLDVDSLVMITVEDGSWKLLD